MSPMLADARPDEATAVVETPRLERKRVVIVGAGFAGIAAAKSLRGGDADVTLIATTTSFSRCSIRLRRPDRQLRA